MKILKGVGLSLVFLMMLWSGIYGSSVLENLHLDFIRSQSRNVVTLINSNGGGGTGFLVRGKSGTRYILTNNHICQSAESSPLVAIYRGDKYVVFPIKSYSGNDLCIVEAPKSVKDSFRIARSVKFGERVYSIGHPLLEPDTVSQGELSASVIITVPVGINTPVDKCTGDTYELIDMSSNPMALIFGVMNICLRHLPSNSSTVPILPGNSGSPVVNIYGNVVAVVFAANASGVHSYMVPLNAVKAFLQDL